MTNSMDAASVGRSSRTPVKHFLLNSMVGKLVGALSTNKTPCHPRLFYAVDLCGGDGLAVDGRHDASPLILHKHCKFARNRFGCDARLDVIEIQQNTFDALLANTSHLEGHGAWMRLHNQDAREFTIQGVRLDQAAFVHCDPNTVDQIPLTGAFVGTWNRYTTYLVTLGCNPGGLKRFDRDRRQQWFEYVNLLTSHLPRHHDAVLFWLREDAAQWAYLLSMPRKWSETYSAQAAASGSKMWPAGVGYVSFRLSRQAFDLELRRLFLTKEEYRAG